MLSDLLLILGLAAIAASAFLVGLALGLLIVGVELVLLAVVFADGRRGDREGDRVQ